MEDAEEKGLNLPYHKNTYGEARRKKLSLIPKELIYSNKTSISYSMEFLGNDLNAELAERLLLSSGSLGDSPSATSYFLVKRHNPNAIGYIRKAHALNNDGSIPSQFPYEIFEKGWVLYNFIMSQMPIEMNSYIPQVAYLKNAWTEKGVAWSGNFPVPDSDDSAMVFKVLRAFDKTMDPRIFEIYEKDEYFITYNFELHSSPSVNIHVLDAIKDCHEYRRRDEVIEKILKFLSKKMINGQYWVDKWQITPYYSTGHAAIALCNVDNRMSSKAIDWIMKTQHSNGGWGHADGTLEETAYAVQSLIYYHKNVEKLDMDAISNGVSWLCKNLGAGYPQLWIAKGLYAPLNVIFSGILCVLYMYHVLKREDTRNNNVVEAISRGVPS